MNNLEPENQTRLFKLNSHILELIRLDKKNNLPNKILLSGQKGLGKSTLAYHFINYSLSKNEDFKYDINNFKINPENRSFKTILNKSNINFRNTPLLDLIDNEFMYFIHSYYVKPDNDNCILTNTNYDGFEFCSSVIKENIFATQFHPEKSADKGISIYKNWSLINKLL